MARDHGAGVLHSEVALQLAFKKIAGLADDADQSCEHDRSAGNRPVTEQKRCRKADRRGCNQATDRAGPGLSGRNRRRQARTSDRSADHVCANVTRPDNQQQHDHIDATALRLPSQPDQRHRPRSRDKGHRRRVAVPGRDHDRARSRQRWPTAKRTRAEAAAPSAVSATAHGRSIKSTIAASEARWPHRPSHS